MKIKQFQKLLPLWLGLFAIVGLVTSCGEGDGPTPPDVTPDQMKEYYGFEGSGGPTTNSTSKSNGNSLGGQ